MSHALSMAHHVFHVLVQHALGHRPDYRIDHLALMEEKQGWDTSNAIALRHGWVVVNIELPNF